MMNLLAQMRAACRQTPARTVQYMSKCLQPGLPRLGSLMSLRLTHRARTVRRSQLVAKRRDGQRAAKTITRDQTPAFPKAPVHQNLRALVHRVLEDRIQMYLSVQRPASRPDLPTQHLWDQHKQEHRPSTLNAKFPEAKSDRRVWWNGGLAAKPRKQKTRRANKKHKQLNAIVLQKRMLGTCLNTAD